MVYSVTDRRCLTADAKPINMALDPTATFLRIGRATMAGVRFMWRRFRGGDDGRTEAPLSSARLECLRRTLDQESLRCSHSHSRPPEHWEDKAAWDHYFKVQISAPDRFSPHSGPILLRFLSLVHEKGGRVWFAGCGLDPYPSTYAAQGCNVLATDFSSVAVRYQQQLAARLLKEEKLAAAQGTMVVVEHDFTQPRPDGKFDVVINVCAFQGLSSSAMRAAAGNFYAALRPGGTCIIDTMNVQGPHRNVIEDHLMAAGFYIPYQKSERWYRQQLDSTGIVYAMILERPRIPYAKQYPEAQFAQFAERDQKILDSFHGEYERRLEEEAPEVKATLDDPATIVAHVVYATG